MRWSASSKYIEIYCIEQRCVDRLSSGSGAPAKGHVKYIKPRQTKALIFDLTQHQPRQPFGRL